MRPKSAIQQTTSSPTTIEIPKEIVAAVDQVWSELGLTDRRLHRADAQEDLTHECHVRSSCWPSLVTELRRALTCPPHVAVARLTENRPHPALLAAVAASLGELCDPYDAPWSRILQEVPTKPTPTPDLDWHTDSTGWVTPNLFTMLSGVHPAPRGGATDLLHVTTVRTACAHRPEMISTLQSKDFRWIKDPELGGGHYVDKVLGLDRIRFMRSPLRECSPRHLRPTIEDFVGILDRQLPDFEVQLGPGDILAFDNTRLLHRRGHTVDPQRERLLLRAKVMQRNP